MRTPVQTVIVINNFKRSLGANSRYSCDTSRQSCMSATRHASILAVMMTSMTLKPFPSFTSYRTQRVLKTLPILLFRNFRRGLVRTYPRLEPTTSSFECVGVFGWHGVRMTNPIFASSAIAEQVGDICAYTQRPHFHPGTYRAKGEYPTFNGHELRISNRHNSPRVSDIEPRGSKLGIGAGDFWVAPSSWFVPRAP